MGAGYAESLGFAGPIEVMAIVRDPADGIERDEKIRLTTLDATIYLELTEGGAEHLQEMVKRFAGEPGLPAMVSPDFDGIADAGSIVISSVRSAVTGAIKISREQAPELSKLLGDALRLIDTRRDY